MPGWGMHRGRVLIAVVLACAWLCGCTGGGGGPVAITVSPGERIVPSVPTLAWWPVVNTIASSVPIHSASSRSNDATSGPRM